MALSNQTFSDAGGAVADLFGAFANSSGYQAQATGAYAESTNYGLAADLATKNAQYTEESTAIQEAQQTRTNYQNYSGAQSDIAGAGLRQSGSGIAILQDNARQGSLAIQTLQKQGAITEEGFQEQAQAYKNLQAAAYQQAEADESASTTSMFSGLVGGFIKGAAAVATLV